MSGHNPDDEASASNPDEALDKTLAMFGRRVKTSRKALGLSQDVAAARAGVSQSYWSKVERGAVDPSVRQVLRIQMALSAPSIEVLFGRFPSVVALEAAEQDSGD